MKDFRAVESRTGKRPIRILLVDDNENDYIAFRDLLEEVRGYECRVTWVSDFEEAAEAMRNDNFDVCFLDYILRSMSGLDLLRTLSKEGNRHGPIILLTGQAGQGIDLEALELGVADYLKKDGLDPNTLERSIRYSIERAKTLKALRESEERYALALEGSNDGIWDWDVRSDKAFFSDRWKEMLGYESHEVADDSREWFRRVHPEDREGLRKALDTHLEGKSDSFKHEHRVLHKDGQYRWMLSRGIAVRDPRGRATRVAGSQTNVTEEKETQARLYMEALHDGLTGLPNRNLLLDRVGHCIDRTSRLHSPLFAVLFLDLDRFKIINDSLGHMAGDRFLEAVAKRLTLCVRPGDTVSRLGGDEFCILLEEIQDDKDAIRVAKRIQKELTRPLDLNGQDVFTTASIGIAISTNGYRDPEEILRDADAAMYRAKARGKARYEIFDAKMHMEALQQLRLESDLRRAYERDEFLIHYQPIVTLKTGQVSGFEALLRWKHPNRGILAPSKFLKVANETGLLVPIERVVLRRVCEQMQEWKKLPGANPNLSVSVNLIGKQFAEPDFLEEIQAILEGTQVDPASLKLEITEDTIMDGDDRVLETLRKLRRRKIHFYIDDFGTGYSSLSRLQSLPVDTLKIDRSFVTKLEKSDQNKEIVRTIISLAQNLGMNVIAEGMEKDSHLELLRSLKCERGQGFLFSKPVRSETAEKMIVPGRFRWSGAA